MNGNFKLPFSSISSVNLYLLSWSRTLPLLFWTDLFLYEY